MVFRFLCCMLFGVSIFVCTRKISSTAGEGEKCIVRAGKQMKLRAEHSAERHGQKPQTCCGIHLQKLSWFLLIYLLILHTYTYKTRLSLCRLLFQWRPLIATNSTSWDGWCSSAGEWEGGSGKNLTQMYMRLMTTRCKKQNPPIVCGLCARSLSGAVEAAGVQFLDMASAWPGACRAAHPARRRRWTTRADTIVSGRRLIALCSSWVVQCFNGGLRRVQHPKRRWQPSVSHQEQHQHRHYQRAQ